MMKVVLYLGSEMRSKPFFSYMEKICSEILELYIFFSLIWLFNVFITWLKTGVMRLVLFTDYMATR